MKVCSRCHKEKQLTEFSKDKKNKDGLCRSCKDCAKVIWDEWKQNNRERHLIYQKQYYQDNKEKRCAAAKQWKIDNPERSARWFKTRRLREKYNITIEEKEALQAAQNNKCAVCKADFSLFTRDCAVDHDHTTGKVRGLLCNSCNSLLGHARDNITVLLSAVEYLRQQAA